MAAIDKYYCKDKNEALQLIKKLKEAGEVEICTFLGKTFKFEPSVNLYLDEVSIEKVKLSNEFDEFPLWNSPYYMDTWLWKNCKEFPNVIKDLKWKYGIKDDMTEEEALRQFVQVDPSQYELATDYKIIKGNLRGYSDWWWIGVDFPVSEQKKSELTYSKTCFLRSKKTENWWWNNHHKCFVPRGLPWDSNITSIHKSRLTKRNLKNILKGLALPKGAIVTITARWDKEIIIKMK